jgi:NAD-dependent DNA ligase
MSSSSSSSGVDPNNEQDWSKETIYRELQGLSGEIRRHDALYYTTSNNKDDTTNNIHHQQQQQQTRSSMISDEDYDALTRREEEICRAYPELLAKWEKEKELGKEATRVGGRVGMITMEDDKEEDNNDSSSHGTTKAITTRKPRFQKRTHVTPMLSLDNVTTKDQLGAWLERVRKKLLVSSATSQPQGPPNVTIITEP